MKTALADELFQKELITQSELENSKVEKPLSVHWDLRSLLYLGILLLTTSIGILIYKNIDTIGHDVLLIIISVLTVACFIYCFKMANGYKHTKINSATIWPDYILLVGCLLLLTLVGYAQFQYNIFGTRWGLALFIPMVLVFLVAYYFDHLGVLSLAITNLAAWAGVAITPTTILRQKDFNEERIMFTGLVLGAFLIGLSMLSKTKNIKAHFSFTYRNFGIHLFFISLLAILFTYDGIYLLLLLALALVAFVFYKMAISEGSSYFLVVTLLYFYIGLSYAVVRLLSIDSTGGIYGMLLYFIFSGIGLITIFKKLQKKIKIQ
ncbi:MAG: DUF2157 domain-containing protein [Ginsengibacter sp.]